MIAKFSKRGRPRVGLALSGGAARGIAHVGVLRALEEHQSGAARGIAHVGVLRALEEHQIPVDAIAGCSAGALVGGVYAAGLPIEELEKLARKLRWRHMGRVALSRLGFQTSAPMERILRGYMPVTRFEDLKIPFAAVATDLRTGTAVVLSQKGDVPLAIRASCGVPGWYVPVKDDQGRFLVDGGLVAALPTTYVRPLGADLVIGVDVNGEGATFMGNPRTVLGVMIRSILAVERIVTEQQTKDADLLIVPKVGHIRWDETRRGEELLNAGYQAGLEKINQIKALIASASSSRIEAVARR
jgi:NTE family protein